MEEENVKEAGELEGLIRELGAAPALQDVGELLVEHMMRVTAAEAGTFWYMDEDEGVLLPLVARGPRSEVLRGLNLQRGEGIAGHVIERCEAVAIEDVSQDDRWAMRFDQVTGFTTRSMLVLPVVAGDRVIGALQLVNRIGGGVLHAGDLRRCQEIMTQVGGIICAKKLHDNETRFARSVLHVLVSLVEALRPEDKGHAGRVKEHSLLVAAAMSLPQSEARALAVASLLHDLGKVIEGDTQKHPAAGARLVHRMQPGLLARQIWLGVLYHHERYDGSGYPAGLKGEDIPLVARIVGMVDFFDHLTDQGQFDFPVAVEQVAKCSGIYFDPRVVAAFSAVAKDRFGEA